MRKAPITSSRDMAMLNELDHFYLILDVLDLVPSLGNKGTCLHQLILDELVEHKLYITHNAEDIPEIREWMWKV